MFSLKLQNTTASTEASYLMLQYIFDELGFINLTIKTSAKNKQAAKMLARMGMTLDGIIRDAVVVGGYALDGAWYSLQDIEWPAIKKGFEEWLHPDNFDAQGKQKKPLRIDRK